MDKGHQGLNKTLRAVIPHKKNVGFLSTNNRRRNEKISLDCVIVENFFGRETMLWETSDDCYKLSERTYDTVLIICQCLTNFHIMHYAMRDEKYPIRKDL